MICKTNTSVCVCGKDNPCKVSESMTKEIKIKCDDCKFVEECVDYGWDGCRKFTPKPSKPVTEQEYLQSCNTEQLAESLLNIMANNEFTLYLLHTEKKSVQEIKGAVVEWLKQPHS